MVGSGEGDINWEGEVESALRESNEKKNNNGSVISSLGRQSSIYSLTLEELQQNFGSMKMDEFLTSIWNAEDNQQEAFHMYNTTFSSTNPNNNEKAGGMSMNNNMIIRKQPSLSLSRQASLTIPPPLSSKTVDQVWSEIHNSHNNNSHPHAYHNNNNSQSNRQR